MNKSELIDVLANKHNHLSTKDIELSIKIILEQMAASLATNDRIEIRGFGSFRIRERNARVGRNPKSGEAVDVPAKKVPFFKAGKELREIVDEKGLEIS